jgi:cyanophycinase-like exopeptidase
MGQEDEIQLRPGPIVLFGSGETAPSGRKIYETIFRNLPYKPRVALLETPAGFELNSTQVIGRVGEFIQLRLQNYEPQITIVPARKRGTPFSPDDPELIAPLYDADVIFMGPGSPTYAVRQLQNSLAWYALLACHRLGTAIVFASAATVAASLYSIPVYEIYKVGEEIHWKDGLDFFGMYGLPLVFVPHWNNKDGGEELDTSRCFMGKPRFAGLMEMIPSELTVMGIDEKTALLIEPEACTCRVIGLGGVTLIHTGPAHRSAANSESLNGTGLDEVAQNRQAHVHQYRNGQLFSLQRIGPFEYPDTGSGLPDEVWRQAIEARHRRGKAAEESPSEDSPPAEVLSLVNERQAARARKDWRESDRLRDQVLAFGWQIQDTPEGPRVVRNE